VGFAQQIRRLLSDTCPFQFDRPVLPYARLGEGADGFPQSLRDRLFDARLSRLPAERRRWALFTEVAAGVRPELGDGTWEMVFDRVTGLADLLYLRESGPVTLEMLGAGAQRFLRLLAEMALAKERFVALEEPEWRLSPELQRRFAALARRVVQSGVGPTQVLMTTHSPIMAAQGTAFSLELSEGAPLIQKKPWDAGFPAEPESSTTPDAPGGLNDLIGLVESLAEIEPEKLVAAGPSPASAPRPAFAGR
jgi:hypothetical protein